MTLTDYVHTCCEIGRFMLYTVSISSKIIVITVKNNYIIVIISSSGSSSSGGGSGSGSGGERSRSLYSSGRNCPFLSDSKPLASDGHL